jgi:choline dehydrogenase
MRRGRDEALTGYDGESLAFDFVIVGAGAAGCVLANRLSASGRHSVALIEAGPTDRHPAIHVPALVGCLIGHPQLDWGHRTVPQSHAGGRQLPLPRGRVIGGCTSTNGMVYFRGHPVDFDEWQALGCEGWGYADVLPYFRRSEDNAVFGGEAHGQGGPVRVSSYDSINPLTRRFVAAAGELGFPEIADFNAGNPEGFGVRQAMIRQGRRESAATAFLARAKRRSNLTVMSGCLVQAVVIRSGRATGIAMVDKGHKDRPRTLTARQGVILAAGAFGSPAILERSGIGDSARLSALGIETLHHVPQVGENLQDHLVAPVQMRTASAEPYVVDWRVLPRLVANCADYLITRRGPLASNVFEATGFVRTRQAGDRPDIQLIFMPMHRAQSPVPVQRGFGALVALLRPESRGSVHIIGPAPDDPLAIDPAFLSAPGDMAPLVEGVRLARRLFATRSFAGLKARECLPGMATSDDEIAEAIRQSCVTVHHPVGTCRMGADRASVVDPALQVRGLDALWVADASIMPRLPGGNTAAAVYMIAEKASDMILQAAR